MYAAFMEKLCRAFSDFIFSAFFLEITDEHQVFRMRIHGASRENIQDRLIIV